MNDSNEDELDRLAREELMKEAKRGAERAKELGAYGWVKPSGISTDKKFLGNVLVSTLRSNKRKKKPLDKDDQDTRQNNGKRHNDEHTRPNSKHPSKNSISPTLRNEENLKCNYKRKHSSETEIRKKIENNDHINADQNMVLEERNKCRNESEKLLYGKLQNEMKHNRKNVSTENVHNLEDNNNNSESPKDARLCQEKTGNEKKGDNSECDIVAKHTYNEDNKVHRKRKTSIKNEEELLIANFKKHQNMDTDRNPKEKVIEYVGEYLLDKRHKKKSKHKDKKSHKSKHKHKKHHKHKEKYN